MRLFHISVLYLRFTKVKKGEYSKQIKFNCSGINRLNPGLIKNKNVYYIEYHKIIQRRDNCLSTGSAV